MLLELEASQCNEVIYEIATAVKGLDGQTTTVTPGRLLLIDCLLFDMRLMVYSFTAVCGPSMDRGCQATINHLCGYRP